MLIRRLNGDLVEFVEIERVEAQLLLQIHHVAETNGDPNPEARLFSDPIDPNQEQQFVKDWDELVRPELRHLFLSSRQTVEEDLARLDFERGRVARLEFPLKHVDAWLNALNQARLVLASRHEFTEEELAQPGPLTVRSRRDFILLQINFYAVIQDGLISVLGYQD